MIKLVLSCRQYPDRMEIFSNDDAGYLNWIEVNPSGFVLNAKNPLRSVYLFIHWASCCTIKGTPNKGKDWTNKYIKVCSSKLSEISGWTLENFGYQPTFC